MGLQTKVTRQSPHTTWKGAATLSTSQKVDRSTVSLLQPTGDPIRGVEDKDKRTNVQREKWVKIQD